MGSAASNARPNFLTHISIKFTHELTMESVASISLCFEQKNSLVTYMESI